MNHRDTESTEIEPNQKAETAKSAKNAKGKMNHRDTESEMKGDKGGEVNVVTIRVKTDLNAKQIEARTEWLDRVLRTKAVYSVNGGGAWQSAWFWIDALKTVRVEKSDD